MNVDSSTTLGAMLYAADRAAALRKRANTVRANSANPGEALAKPAPAAVPTPMPLWHEAPAAVRERYRNVAAQLGQRFRIPVIGKRFDLLPAEEFRGLVQGAGVALDDPDTALALFIDAAVTLLD